MYTILGPDNQTQHGPSDLKQVRQWIADGLAYSKTLVFKEGATDWEALESLPELASLLQPAKPLPPSARPNSPKVFGIMNIIFSILMLLVSPVFLLGTFAIVWGITSAEQLFKISGQFFPIIPDMFHAIKTQANFFAVVGVFFVIAAILYLISGIGLVKYRGWGRKIAMGNAAFIIVFAIFYAIYRTTKLADITGPLRVDEIVMLALWIIYSGIQLGLLTRPTVRDACP